MAVRVRFPLRVLKGVHQMMSTFSFYSERESFSRWRFGQLVYGRLKFARANYCLWRMNHLENKFSVIIRQIQQSSIASTSLRLPLNCCARSNPFGLVQSVALWHSCLQSAIVAVAIFCFCQMIAFENGFSVIICQIQTIYDCNCLLPLCSNLLRPLDSA